MNCRVVTDRPARPGLQVCRGPVGQPFDRCSARFSSVSTGCAECPGFSMRYSCLLYTSRLKTAPVVGPRLRLETTVSLLLCMRLLPRTLLERPLAPSPFQYLVCKIHRIAIVYIALNALFIRATRLFCIIFYQTTQTHVQPGLTRRHLRTDAYVKPPDWVLRPAATAR